MQKSNSNKTRNSFVGNNFACFVIYDLSLQLNEDCPSVRCGPGKGLSKTGNLDFKNFKKWLAITHYSICNASFFFCGAATQRGSWLPHSWGFLNHTQRRTTFGRTPLDEWSARCRDLYLTTHNTHNRQISMPPVGFEPTISAGERPQTYALDSPATRTGM